jgi:hypothetical protein
MFSSQGNDVAPTYCSQATIGHDSVCPNDDFVDSRHDSKYGRISYHSRLDLAPA